jgi:propanol-preferring alcohol dehydrogenase
MVSGSRFLPRVTNLKCEGTITLVSATTDGPIKVDNLLLNMNRASLRGHCCGCSPNMEKCIEYSSRVNVKPLVKTFSLRDFTEAYDDVMGNRAQFRNVIVFP